MPGDGFWVQGYNALLSYLLKFEGMGAERFHVEAAAYVKAQILARTSQGMDASGTKFAPYSAPWKLIRAAKGLPVRRVDLFFTGSMLAAMTWKANKERAVIFFRPSADRRGISNPAKAYYNQEGRRPRRFFAMSKQDIRALVNIYWDILKAKACPRR